VSPAFYTGFLIKSLVLQFKLENMRQSFKRSDIGMNPEFRNRGEEQTRIETFSDAVFALAVTLLVLSSSVPETFEALSASFSELVPFAICITILTTIWYQHYLFFIRYGFRDVRIVAINTVLLFVVLIYVYPLKFLFKVLANFFYYAVIGDQAGLRHLFTNVLPQEKATNLMAIYGMGAMAVFLVLAWMFWIALRRKDALELTPLEIFHTRSSLYDNLLMASIPFLSVLISVFGVGGQNWSFALSGFCYWLYIIVMPVFSRYRKRRKKKLFQ
jgi:hypothetical protein